MINAFKIDWKKNETSICEGAKCPMGKASFPPHLSSSVKPDSETALQKNPLNFEKV